MMFYEDRRENTAIGNSAVVKISSVRPSELAVIKISHWVTKPQLAVFNSVRKYHSFRSVEVSAGPRVAGSCDQGGATDFKGMTLRRELLRHSARSSG